VDARILGDDMPEPASRLRSKPELVDLGDCELARVATLQRRHRLHELLPPLAVAGMLELSRHA
jgi:hypothetical protein